MSTEILRKFVGLSMMCYTEGAEDWFLYLAKNSFRESHPKGRIGKRLYLHEHEWDHFLQSIYQSKYGADQGYAE